MQAGIRIPDACLKLKHHGTCAVYHSQISGTGGGVCCRRLSVGPHKDRRPFRDVVHGRHSLKAAFSQAGEFRLVVYYGAKGIQLSSPIQILLCTGNGPDNPSAEAGAGISLNF